MRKQFIDNLRWMDVFLLIPYHAAQAFNTWGELNYICFVPNKAISSFIVFFSPFFMPLLFLLAGMSSRYALNKRTYGQFIIERVKRLIVPFLFGTLALCPVLAYFGDKRNFGYEGSFFGHYKVFFTKWTDLAGFDGGFNVGQFWFLYFLFVISVVCVGMIVLAKKAIKKPSHIENTPFWAICLMVVPLPFLYDLLAIGGKSFAEYYYIFLIGYCVLSHDKVIEKTERYRYISLTVGLAAAIANVYMFIWSGRDYGVLNVTAKAFAEWFMILALIGIGKHRLDSADRITAYMSQRSFPFFSLHFIWIVLFQYLFSGIFADNTVLLFIVPVIFAYSATLISAEICLKIPILCFLMGTKNRSKQGKNNR
ncbi:MAG: acyltransferase [Lachnospiraceae bacterium]|nr:acyltransferase [Lachnospiraceae bacterium]